MAFLIYLPPPLILALRQYSLWKVLCSVRVITTWNYIGHSHTGWEASHWINSWAADQGPKTSCIIIELAYSKLDAFVLPQIVLIKTLLS